MNGNPSPTFLDSASTSAEQGAAALEVPAAEPDPDSTDQEGGGPGSEIDGPI